jgi:hypothetical protein
MRRQGMSSTETGTIFPVFLLGHSWSQNGHNSTRVAPTVAHMVPRWA